MRARTILALLVLCLAPALGAQPAARDGPRADAVRIPILVYHSVAPHHPSQTPAQREFDVDPDVFTEQMRLLGESGYVVVSLGTLVDALLGRAEAPERAVVLTFDDGWETQYRHAFPVLRRLGLTATFFVPTASIGDDPRIVTWEQLREMQRAGMSIGSHSRTHPSLPRTRQALSAEIAGSRDELTRALDAAPEFFAYPFGAADAQVVAAVREAGYRGARGYAQSASNTADDLWSLHAVEVTDDMTAFRRVLRIPDSVAAPPRR